MYVQFRNEYGCLELFGGSGAVYNMIQITGLGLPPREPTVVCYPDERGQKTVAVRDLPRVITIAGDMRKKGLLQQEITRMCRILYHPGRLFVQAGNKRRAIGCMCTAFDDPERINKEFASFVMQFTCDDPAFGDFAPTTTDIFGRTDLIAGSFTLPCVFTQRVSEADIINRGDMDTLPTLHICCIASGGSGSDAGGVAMVNQTTGAVIHLRHKLTEGETVTVDIVNATVSSDREGNLLDCLADDSYLTDFRLIPGVNHLQAVNYNTADTITVACEYTNQYLESVY